MKYKKQYLFIFVLTILNYNYCKSQTVIQPVARFTFNNSCENDEINHHIAKLIGTSYTEDRFGNANNAVFLSGHAESYINLGTYKALKPKVGTISLWIKIENPVYSGKGLLINPILLTKCNTLDDFYEAYSIYYDPSAKKISVSFSKDSTKQINHYTEKSFKQNKWYHLVFTYDNHFSAFYLDGKLQSKFAKSFETHFLENDSVLIGNTSSKKNERFLKANIDDIAFYDAVLTQDEVNVLYNAPNPNKNKIVLKWTLVCITIILIGTLLYFFIKHQIKVAVQKERKRLELNNKLLETELRVNRASMNPHFLFNSLNALHNFVLANEIDNASNYLIKFSKLIRKILDSNMHESISLNLEIELLEHYLELENLRFEENIKYTIVTDDSLVASTIRIPIMMLQPFVENAIWHGLLTKAGHKKISIGFSVVEDKYIFCLIEDNGVGRKEITETVVEKKSMAIAFIKQRLELLNKIHNLNCSLIIEDKVNQQGTIVKIKLPILKP